MAVDKQIMNRRQGVLINNIDPEILTEAKLSADGYVRNTDYAGADTAGVVKVTASNGAYISTAGALGAASRTAAQYETANNTMIIGKGTLENIKLSIVLSVLSVLADTAAPSAADGTVVSGLYATRQNSEWSFGFGTVTPPETP